MPIDVSIVGPDQLAACLLIRRRVFIEGQGVPENREVDGLDGQAMQFLAIVDGEPLGTARLLVRSNGVAKAQRVAVLETARGRGVGRALMKAVENEAHQRGHRELVLDAQVDVIPFYERQGYVAEGALFLDAGLLHRKMRKSLTPETMNGMREA